MVHGPLSMVRCLWSVGPWSVVYGSCLCSPVSHETPLEHGKSLIKHKICFYGNNNSLPCVHNLNTAPFHISLVSFIVCTSIIL